MHMATRTLIQASFNPDETNDLDHYRREQPNPPTRARAVRDLALAALRSSTRSTAKGFAISARRRHLRALKGLLGASKIDQLGSMATDGAARCGPKSPPSSATSSTG